MNTLRLATYAVDGSTKYGAVVEGGIVDLSARFGGDYPTLREVIAADALTRLAEDAARYRPDHALDAITWLPPVPAPEKIICIGVNYPDRNAEYKDGQDAPKYPSMFMRTPRSFVGHLSPLVRPRASAQLDYEGEVVLVVGKPGRHIPESEALNHIAAVTLCNEGTIRDWVRHAKFNVTQGKNFELHRKSRSMAGSLQRRGTNRRHQADDAGQRRNAAGRPHLAADLRLPLFDQLYLHLHDAGSRRRHRHGNTDRRRRAVRSAALFEAGRRRRGRGRKHRRAAQWRDRRDPLISLASDWTIQ